MKHYIPQVGDVIFIRRGLYRHVGVYVGPGCGDGRDIIHNDKSKGVVQSTLAEFSGGTPVYLHKQSVGNWQQRQAIADRAAALVGRKYNLWNFNCEHAASLAQTGNAESPQLAVAFIAIFALLLGVLFIRSKK